MDYISKATELNWKRLKTNSAGRLSSRANKIMSRKTFIPKEYLTESNSEIIINDIVEIFNNSGSSIGDIVYTLCLLKLHQYSLCDENWNVPNYISSSLLSKYEVVSELTKISFPKKEFDFIGAAYQSLKKEGSKSYQGSYYTPRNVAKEMSGSFYASEDNKLLDPCCGTGAILLSVNCSSPLALFGCDIDPIAVLICKTNLFCRFNKIEFTPNIICGNYLKENIFEKTVFKGIITNPPWGACIDSKEIVDTTLQSNESSSIFLEKAINNVSEKGYVSFLLPKSILNISIHEDIRDYILRKSKIVSITYYSNLFTGVSTELFNIVLCKEEQSNENILIDRNGDKFTISQSYLEKNDNKAFIPLKKIDSELKEKIISSCIYDLSNSIWALGIVTGDNKNKVYKTHISDSEPVYTGKEVKPFVLGKPKNYIKFRSDTFQQMAREDYYRANEKLVYKFISKKLTFALDYSGALCLNSANILIPKIPNMGLKTVAAFLNSKIYQYLYLILFDDPKILKKNLCKLSFPSISERENKKIESLVEMYLKGDVEKDRIDHEIAQIFRLNETELMRIEEIIDGSIKN